FGQWWRVEQRLHQTNVGQRRQLPTKPLLNECNLGRALQQQGEQDEAVDRYLHSSRKVHLANGPVGNAKSAPRTHLVHGMRLAHVLLQVQRLTDPVITAPYDAHPAVVEQNLT